jgi:hypothetical protein
VYHKADNSLYFCNKKMKNYLLFISILTCNSLLFAQDTTKNITFSGYVEAFYAYEFNQPQQNKRPNFLYSHNRQNEFNVNLAYIKAAFSDAKTRANIALATGTYMLDNYANENSISKNILEANAGIRLGAKTWLDIGILPSHIGFESAISKDCWTLTRSLMAENSPYFETGAKMTFSPNDKWTIAALVLNGWQRISRVNSTPSVGSQIVGKMTDNLTLNWSSFYGNDRPDSVKQMRFFNNFYANWQISKKVGIIAGFDIGSEKPVTNVGKNNIWYSPILITRLQLSDTWALAARIENYTDKNGVLISPDFKTNGYSFNLDYTPLPHALFRIEARLLDSPNKLFSTKKGYSDKNFYITSSLAIGF